MPLESQLAPDVLAQLADDSIGTVDLSEDKLIDQSNGRATVNTCYRTCYHGCHV